MDVVNGGFQTDLSLLLENNTLPSEYASRYIYSGTNTPVEPAPARFAGAEPMPSPDPKWSFLHSHYQLYKEFAASSSNYRLAASQNERTVASGFFDKQQILPVVSNAQFIFSTAPANRNGTDYLYLWTDIFITLWNPYDVEITVNPMEFEIYRLPLQLELFRKRNGVTSSVNGNLAQYGNMYAGRPFRSRITNSFTMQPGEYKIFGSDTYTIHWDGRYYKHGLELTENWDLRAGGVEVQDNAFGTGYQQVQPGDVYTLNVSAARVNSGTGFDETNNEEVVCYMKIFQQDAGRSNFSTFEDIRNDLDSRRRQIGAIEIDLPGTNAELAKFFPTYGHNEMPEQIIPNTALPAVGQSMHLKVPFLTAAIRLKTEAESQFTEGGPSSMWLHNGITNQYFSNGLKNGSPSGLRSI